MFSIASYMYMHMSCKNVTRYIYVLVLNPDKTHYIILNRKCRFRLYFKIHRTIGQTGYIGVGPLTLVR